MKLYIAGPMTGLPEFNYPAFYAADHQLDAAGYEPINPRTKGWRMPEGAVYVGRGTQWGNPWRVGWPVMTQTPTGDGDGTLRGQEFTITRDLAVVAYQPAQDRVA